MEAECPSPALLPDNKPETADGSSESETKGLPGVCNSTPSVEVLVPIGRGLVNQGNTCFLNAVLQCITHTVPLVQAVGTSAHLSPCSDGKGDGVGGEGGFCSLCALKQHLGVCFDPATEHVWANGFVSYLSNISSTFNRYQEQDAHEYLNYLLDSLHTSSLDPQSRDGPSSMQADSFIKQIFGGRLRSQVECCDCGHISNTFEPILDLSLEIENAESLEEALESFTKVEKIEDPEMKFTCDGCNARVSVQKQFTLEQTPPVVAFHLKRFKCDGYSSNKISKFIEYPKDLDLKPFLSVPDDVDNLNYELYAVLVHEGHFAACGHYYCFIRSSPHIWYIMDDDTVVRVYEKQALEQRAYILFYMKKGTPWFLSLMQGQRRKVDLDINNASPIPVLGRKDKCQKSYRDSQDNWKNRMVKLNSKEGWNSMHAYMNRARRMKFNNSLGTLNRDEKEKPSDDASEDRFMNDTGKDHVSCSLEASKNDAAVTEDNRPDRALDQQNMTPPCRPSFMQVLNHKFYNEISDDAKENIREWPPNAKQEECPVEVNDREEAALTNYLRPMPCSRGSYFGPLLRRPQRSTSAELQKWKED